MTDCTRAEHASPWLSCALDPGPSVRLDDFRGRPLVMAFYPAGLEPGVHRSDGAVQRVLPEFQRLGADLVEDLDRPRLVSRRVRQGSGTFTSRCSLTSIPKAELRQAATASYDDNIGMSERALVRGRRGGRHPLELRLADRASTPAPTGSSPALESLAGGLVCAEHDVLDRPQLTVPLSGRGPCLGPGRLLR